MILDLKLETLTYIKIMVLFENKGPELGFLNQLSIDEGLVLEDFRITIASGCTDDEKRESVQQNIRTWYDKGERILEL